MARYFTGQSGRNDDQGPFSYGTQLWKTTPDVRLEARKSFLFIRLVAAFRINELGEKFQSPAQTPKITLYNRTS